MTVKLKKNCMGLCGFCVCCYKTLYWTSPSPGCYVCAWEAIRGGNWNWNDCVCLLFFVVCIFPSLYTLVWYPIQSKYGAGIADTDIDSDDRNKVSIPSHYYQCYRFLDQSAHLYYTHTFGTNAWWDIVNLFWLAGFFISYVFSNPTYPGM